MDDNSALPLLHRAGQRADKIFSQALGQIDLTPRQYFVLQAVAASDGLSQTAIMNVTGIDRSSTAEIVGRLVAKGMLRRRRSKRDARVYAVRLTEGGRDSLAVAEPAAQATDAALLSALSAAQRDGFLEALSRVSEEKPVSSDGT